MKVAITDYTFPDLNIERQILEGAGHEVVAWKEKRTAAELPELVRDADAVITQFAPINADVIDAMQKAKVIVRYGIGFDNVDVEAARTRNIPVSNIPSYCIDEVADHTLSFLLACTRQVIPNTLLIREGQWGLATPLNQMSALKDLTVGVVGFGQIGKEVVNRLRPFKCNILVHDPIAPAAAIEQAGAKSVDLQTLYAKSDAVTLHCPSLPDTRGMINRDSLAQMKQGVIFLNLARGDLVISDDLVAALQSGHVSAAALDVFNPEPIPADHPIRKMPNVVIAAHISSASPRAVTTLRETAAQLATLVLKGEAPRNVVNGVKPA